jgi:sterol desaturase/sphingolipid hydroxylase (fatty acid hydroxylase superfamily)
MTSSVWDQINSPLLYALPFFVLFIGIEVAAVRHAAREDLRGYDARDARTSITMWAGSLVFSTLLKTVSLVVYVLLWTYLAPWHVPSDTWWSWLLLIVAVDLAWYVTHRFSHRVRFAWAGHQAHHSSEYFNLSTAVRQKWNPWVEGIFWLPLPLLGFTPWTIYIAFSVNLVYQFFIHTETVDKLPRAVEFVTNTPSHHRVHHGSDPEYLDRNYGGIFIVWDRLFGSFRRGAATTAVRADQARGDLQRVPAAVRRVREHDLRCPDGPWAAREARARLRSAGVAAGGRPERAAGLTATGLRPRGRSRGSGGEVRGARRVDGLDSEDRRHRAGDVTCLGSVAAVLDPDELAEAEAVPVELERLLVNSVPTVGEEHSGHVGSAPTGYLGGRHRLSCLCWSRMSVDRGLSSDAHGVPNHTSDTYSPRR